MISLCPLAALDQSQIHYLLILMVATTLFSSFFIVYGVNRYRKWYKTQPASPPHINLSNDSPYWPPSISMTFYAIGPLFVFFLLFSTGSISVINMTAKPSCLTLSNIGAWSLAGVGFLSNYKAFRDLGRLHVAAAVIGIVLILLGFWYDYHMKLFSIVSISAVAFGAVALSRSKKTKKFWTWLVELTAFAFMNIGFYLVILSFLKEQ